MHIDLFNTLNSIADNIVTSSQRGSKNIFIKEPNRVEDDESSLKLISGNKLRIFAISINWYFNNKVHVSPEGQRLKMLRENELEALESFFKNQLVKPCQKLIERATNAMQALEELKRFSRDPTNIGIRLQRKSEPILDYQLEALRVCKLL